MRNRIKILSVLALTTVLMIGYTKVEAVLETKPGVPALVSTTASSFFEKIRAMESVDGAFGLNATFVTESGTYKETSESNNIDVHMIKNTEWGIVAMMSASDYGAGNGNVTGPYNSSTDLYNVTSSTTGNMSGIFGIHNGMSTYEYVSAGIVKYMSVSHGTNIKNAEARYIDRYVDGTISSDFSRYIPGDATFETKAFAGGGGTFVYSSHPVFERGNGGVFHSNVDFGNSYSSVGSRACVWSDLGL